ncbi:MAG: hypothetical protein COU69_00270 [Candidatus Pacebacteria bacterium CG10_big_fil_rev_8_21_14_0_10_56_10]|nr:MAG: hypothetical protein COU69_00270 [Candidatus Pacebacteria bacterium CG10_big_fil_rev_8_21_14_0_10_56_10]
MSANRETLAQLGRGRQLPDSSLEPKEYYRFESGEPSRLSRSNGQVDITFALAAGAGPSPSPVQQLLLTHAPGQPRRRLEINQAEIEITDLNNYFLAQVMLKTYLNGVACRYQLQHTAGWRLSGAYINTLVLELRQRLARQLKVPMEYAHCLLKTHRRIGIEFTPIAQPDTGQTLVLAGGDLLWLVGTSLHINQQMVVLKPRLAQTMLVLMRHRGVVISHLDIESQANHFDESYDHKAVARRSKEKITSLRKLHPVLREHIITVSGKGYFLE